jgi:hypothetical protein
MLMPAEPRYLTYFVCSVYDRRAGRKQVWGGDPMMLHIHDHIHTSRAPPPLTSEFAFPHLFPPFSISKHEHIFSNI